MVIAIGLSPSRHLARRNGLLPRRKPGKPHFAMLPCLQPGLAPREESD
jgi:hypothetical protein